MLQPSALSCATRRIACAPLGGEDRGRLIQDQELRVLKQAADDLDPLPLADGRGDAAAAGSTGRAVALGQQSDAGRKQRQIELAGAATAMFSTTVTDSNSENAIDMPMPSRRAAAGLAMVTGAPFHRISAGVRLRRAVDDLHQRAFAAPFSPSTAWISPGLTASEISSLATIPG